MVASRTSPTNIGLSLLANLAAVDLGYLSVKGLIERTGKTFLTLNKMKKYRGHWYNWYDTRTLEPLYPLYISTVDSGNLAGHLLTLSQGIQELGCRTVYSAAMMDGFLDTVRIMRDVVPGDNGVKELEKILSASPKPETCYDAFLFIKNFREKVRVFIQTILPDDKLLLKWGNTLLQNCEDYLEDIRSLFPWIEKEYVSFLHRLEQDKGEMAGVTELTEATPSLETIVEYEQKICFSLEQLIQRLETGGEENSGEKLTYYKSWLADFRQMVQAAKERINILHVLSAEAGQLADMDFRFLYDEKKSLFSIGYNVMEQRYDASSYDMLASEARLCSYLAIARGEVPVEHWFR